MELIDIKVNESPLGENPKEIYGIGYLSQYVCGECVVAANGLILLENVDGRIHFPQIFVITDISGSPRCINFNRICICKQFLLCG